MIKIKYPELFLEQSSNWFTKVIQLLGFSIPNIFVETGTYLGHGIKYIRNDFREVHSIELNDTLYNNSVINFKNDPYIYLYHADSPDILNKLIKISEPVVFHLDAYYYNESTSFGKIEDKGSPILRELSIIGKRNYMDIIFINDIKIYNEKTQLNITIDDIIFAYNRMCSYWIFEDVSKIIIIPQK
jgi:hypothetical protein